jgi:hypothetical protein
LSANYTDFNLAVPKVVAIAKDKTIKPYTTFGDPVNLPGGARPQYGSDMAFGSGAGAPENKKVGTNPTDLAQKMRKLLEILPRCQFTLPIGWQDAYPSGAEKCGLGHRRSAFRQI